MNFFSQRKKYPNSFWSNRIAIFLALLITIAIIFPFFNWDAQTGILIILTLSLFIFFKHPFDLLLLCQPFFLIFAQFMSTAFVSIRWLILFVLILISLYIVRKQTILINKIVLGLLLLATYSCGTSFFSYNPIISFLRSISLLFLGIFLLLLNPAIHQLHPSVNPTKFILRIYLWVSIIIVFSNAIFFLLYPSESMMGGRFKGWFVNPNGLGVLIGVFFAPIIWNEIILNKTKLGKTFYLFFFILALYELISTGSRASILAGIISLSIIILGQCRLPTRFFITILSCLTIFGVMAIYPEGNFIKTLVFRNEQFLSGSNRLQIWQNVWERSLEHPFIGTGLGVDTPGTGSTKFALESVSFTTEKANSYLGLFHELGIIGVSIFILYLFIPIIKSSWNVIIKKDSPEKANKLILVGILGGGFINSLFEGWLFSVGDIGGYSLWIFAYLLLNRNNDLIYANNDE